MNETLHALGIPGSLRRGSYNRSLLRAACELAPEEMEIEVVEIGGLPLYNQDLEEQLPPEGAEFRAKVRAADAVLFVTPEYNYSIPALVKNAVDWASRPPGKHALRRKPVALMGATTGMGGTMRAQLALRQCFVYTESYCLLKPEVLVPFAATKFDGAGVLTDEQTREFVSQFLAALAIWVRQLRAGGLAEEARQ